MAGFTTAAILGLAFAGTATQAVGQWKAGTQAKKAGEAQRRAAESQAELLDFNAQVADLQAVDATARGLQEESRFRQGVRVMIGSQRAGIAAGGIDVGYGSAVDVQADAAMLGELDALTIRQNAAREAWGYKVEAADTRQRAKIARTEGVMLEAAGRANQTAARIGAVGGILGAGGSLLEARYGFPRGK
jgi:hypothetical protein